MAEQPKPVPLFERAEADAVAGTLLRAHLRQPPADQSSLRIVTMILSAASGRKLLALLLLAPGDEWGGNLLHAIQSYAEVKAELSAGRPGVTVIEEARPLVY